MPSDQPVHSAETVVRDLADRALVALEDGASLEVTPEEYRILRMLTGNDWDAAVSERRIEQGKPIVPLGGVNVVVKYPARTDGPEEA